MSIDIFNSPQILEQLDWSQIVKEIEHFCHFNKTKDTLFTFIPEQSSIQNILDKSEIFLNYQQSQTYKALIDDLRSLSEEAHFNQYLGLIKKEGHLNLKELNELALCIELFVDHGKFLHENELTGFSIQSLNEFSRKAKKSFLTNFRSFVEKDGTIDLQKHPILRELYFKQLQLESQIRKKIQHQLKSSEFEKALQFDTYDLINDRYVLPIRSDSYNSGLGRIISRSESGRTLFVEPHNLSGMNYERLQIVVEIENKIINIEKDLSLTLKSFTNELSHITDLILIIDEFHTRACAASHFNMSKPSFSSTPQMILYSAFHPLIPGAIQNDITLSSDKKGIIISGPNTGGKTATIKTLAISQLLLRFGFFLPCFEAKVFLYEKIFYFGNDQQNLEEGLSSFAAEVKNYTELVGSLADTNLILIDEIFNSTSSEEASALALSFFDKLEELSTSQILVSTHHQTLKSFLHQKNTFKSCHVGFDTDTNRPTYKLHYGSPGSSHALRIFSNMTRGQASLEEIYNNSLQYLDNNIVHYEKLLTSIAKKENELNKLISSNSSLNSQLKNQKESMEGVIRLKVEDKVQKTQFKLNKIISDAEYILRSTKRGEITKAKQLNKKTQELTSQVIKLGPVKMEQKVDTNDYSNLSVPNEFKVGEKYFSLLLKKTVSIKTLNIKKNEALVNAGKIAIKVPLSSLRSANLSTQKPSTTQSFVATDRSAQIEYDCRGMRLEEFQDLVEKSVSDLLQNSVPYITIIHGHGTGVLKNWLRKYIRQTKDIQRGSDQRGNDGETRIELS